MTKRDQERIKGYKWSVKCADREWLGVETQLFKNVDKVVTPAFPKPSQAAKALAIYIREVHRA